MIGGDTLDSVKAFKASTGTLQKAASLKGPRGYAGCAASEAEIVVCGGCSGSDLDENLNTVEVYEPKADA